MPAAPCVLAPPASCSVRWSRGSPTSYLCDGLAATPPLAGQIAAQLSGEGLRVDLDDRKESVGRKIRDAEMGKVPYMLVVGDKEADAGNVSVRTYAEGDLGARNVDELAGDMARQVEEKTWGRGPVTRIRLTLARPTSILGDSVAIP